MPDTKISLLPADTQNNDTFLVPLVDENSPIATKRMTVKNFLKKAATVIVAPAGSGGADFYTTGTAITGGDEVAINLAIQAVIAAGGGKVVLREGNYYVSNHILINAYDVWLEGMGTGTIIHQANNANVDTIILISGFNIAQIKVSHLHIEGNKGNNTFGNGISTQTPNSENSWVILDNLAVWNCPNNGVAFLPNPGSSSYYVSNVHSAGHGGNGFWAGFTNGAALTDSVFINCISETNALNGFFLGTLDTHFFGCKAYFNGSAGGNNHGYTIAGYNNYFTGCQAQDNYGCGFYLNNDGDGTYGTQNNVFVNCDADTNNNPSNNRGATTANTPTGSGFFIRNTKGTQLIGCQSYVRPYPFSWGQWIGVYVTGTSTGTRIIGLMGEGNGNVLYLDDSSGANYNLAGATMPLLATGVGHTVDDVITTLQNLGLVRQS